MTLRARLLIGLIVLTTFGLGVAGAITYHELSNYLLDRVDAQLDKANHVELFFREVRRGDDNTQVAQALLPPGTWAQVRGTDGTPIAQNSGSLGDEGPHLPPKLSDSGTYVTTRSPHYRVLVNPAQSFRVIDEQSGTWTSVQARFIVAIPLHDVDATLHRLLFLELIVAAGVLLTLGFLAWLVVKLGLKPLEEMEETAGAIAAGDLSRRVDVVDERTEVGRLGIALNEMLHKIEEAFHEREESEERLRRFVGDASHELRTPLTSIRGYAELFRRGAADRPEDLEKAMRRIEEEAGRMGVLVDDLLLLARIDQGRPLAREHVDLARITTDAVDDARTVAPERTFDYTPNGAVEVTGDEARLRQVLGNLLQNAVRHTPADTPVHVRVATEGDDAIIEVRDEGPGMAPEDAAHVFERFWRSDASRQRASGGTGLGLAIVAAIADAHGGRAEVQTAPGAGATFRVRVPRNGAAPATDTPAVEPAAEPA